MTVSHRLANLKRIHDAKAPEITRLAKDANTPTRQKQLIYGCLNNLCRISAILYGEISAEPGNYDLLEEAAEIDNALVQLRSFVGSQISLRVHTAA
ncbi:hypothetical protein [Hoeflea sp. AS16]|jgi:hypothetical protein|uniref:hypothetical protein n=1 Tax=unclassified Hoeflea TaxID=2614931 RepID=UPI00317C16BF